jgi:S-adenosylmethionine/arginine decarboxylase-like enzyme
MYLVNIMVWGKLAIINLYNCDPNYIKDKEKIKKFIEKICKEIKMKKVGHSLIKRFGKDSLEGFSAIQFIETATITIHFDEEENRAFIDIFSCKDFNAQKAEKFSKKFFKAKKSKVKVINRS